jgi:hypothetical protein
MSKSIRRAGAVDWRIGIRSGCDFRLVERPGLRLDRKELERLVADLRAVADRCVPGGKLRYGVLSGDPMCLENAVVAVVYDRRTGHAVGFNAMALLDVELGGRPARVLHAGLCMIDQRYRNRGLCWALTIAPAVMAFLRNGLRPLWVTNVTQVPAVAGVFAAAIADVYPRPGVDRAPSGTHTQVVTAVVRDHRAAFGVGDDAELDTGRFVIRNAYTGGSDDLKKTFEESAKHRDERFNSLCRDLLDYERGDDLIQVGRMTCLHWGRLIVRFARGFGLRARGVADAPRRGAAAPLTPRRAGAR